MKVLTWNINGIRASNREIRLKKLLDSLEADIICLQETKVTRDQLDEVTAIVEGYNAFFSFSKVKGGYSGVATFCKADSTPSEVEEGLTGLLNKCSSQTGIGCYAEQLPFSSDELVSLDAEGRALLSEHDIAGQMPLVIMNLYCPRADRDNEERWAFKQNFYHLVQSRCEALLSSGKNVMVVGDMNVSHTKLDHCDPDADPEYFASNESRIWMSQFLLPASEMGENGNDLHPSPPNSMEHAETCKDNGCDRELAGPDETGLEPEHRRQMVDVFRYFHPTRENAFTCWSTVTSARKTNYGTRIDYILVNKDFLAKFAVTCDIRPDIHGSDHCPVEAMFKCSVKASETLPNLCTSLMPEFRGKQKSIKAFFQKGSKQTVPSGTRLGIETFDSGPTVPEPLKSDMKNGDRDFGRKRKASSEKGKAPSKLQKTAARSSQGEAGSQGSLASYFQKSSNTHKSKKVDEKDILVFLNEAKITDSTLREEIFNSNGFEKESSRKCHQVELMSSNNEVALTESDASLNFAIPSGSSVEKNEGPKLFEEHSKTLSKGTGNVERGKISWKSILKGPEKPPTCEGHKEDCVLRTVKKQGPNLGRQFYCCARPEGRPNDKEARCKTFIWRKK